MNYIAEINSFYNWIMLKPIPPDAQALWHVLMQMNNRNSVYINEKWYWKTEFTISNSTLTSILAFSRQQLDRMRNTLIQTGRIVYKKGKGSQSGTYKMIPFDTSLIEYTFNDVEIWIDANNVTQFVTQPVTQIDTQTGHKPLHKSDTNPNLCNNMSTYIKNNNKNKIKNNYSSKDKKSSQKKTASKDSASNYDFDEIERLELQKRLGGGHNA